MAHDCEVRIGTSGWHYKHWRGPFYPEKFPASRMFDFYAERFDTVELNNTFYRLPPVTGVNHWRESAPANFRFAVKGSRYLTHMKKLKDPEPGIEKFFERVDLLGDKLGPVIFQLPPFWDADPGRLDAFLQALPRGKRYSVELRNPTWLNSVVYDVLRRHNAAFCIFEIDRFFSGIEITADFTYIRLHGPGGKYQGSYSKDVLQEWANRILKWRKELRAVYIYFDNDQAGFAAQTHKN